MTTIQQFCRSLLCLALVLTWTLAPPARAQSVIATADLATNKDPAAEALLKRYQSANDPREAQRAFEAIRSLAKTSTHAAYLCGVLGARSSNAVADRSSALRCLEDAARAGVPEAQHRLGMLLLEDKTQHAEAERWLVASSKALPESVYLLALLAASRRPDADAARRIVVEKGASAGYAPAQYELATLLSSRTDAEDKKPLARELLEKAAGQRHPEASVDLAALLEQERREADIPRIVALLTVAAAAGSPRANYALGVRYLRAEGVKRDTPRALALIRQAALSGRVEAQYAFAFMLGNGTGTASDDRAAMEWLARAADQGHVEAMHGLGNYYANGWGVGKSMDVAFSWYCKAAQHGHAGSARLVRRDSRSRECELDATPPLAPTNREPATAGSRD